MTTPEYFSHTPPVPSSCGCPAPEDIEACVLGRDFPGFGQVRKHVESCPGCAAIAAEIVHQVTVLEAAFKQDAAPSGSCPGDEVLAAYLDGVQGRIREEIEDHLAACPACRKRLTALFREVQWLLSEEPEPETAAFHTEMRDFDEERHIIESNAKLAAERQAKRDAARENQRDGIRSAGE